MTSAKIPVGKLIDCPYVQRYWMVMSPCVGRSLLLMPLFSCNRLAFATSKWNSRSTITYGLVAGSGVFPREYSVSKFRRILSRISRTSSVIIHTGLNGLALIAVRLGSLCKYDVFFVGGLRFVPSNIYACTIIRF